MITIINDDLRAIKPSGDIDFFNCDPPYAEVVQESIVSSSVEKKGDYGLNIRVKDLPFAPVTLELMGAIMNHYALARRWCLLFCDSKSVSFWHHIARRKGVRARRDLVWNRWSSPLPGNTKPPHTFEMVLTFHTPKNKLHWNGSGGFVTPNAEDDFDESWTFDQKALRGDAKFDCEKPLDMQLEQMLFFTDPGEHGCDLTCGSGTNPIAAWLLGRDCVGVEQNRDTYKIAVDRSVRAQRGVWEDRDIERMARFCLKHPEAASTVIKNSRCSALEKRVELTIAQNRRAEEKRLLNMLASDAAMKSRLEKKVKALYGI